MNNNYVELQEVENDEQNEQQRIKQERIDATIMIYKMYLNQTISCAFLCLCLLLIIVPLFAISTVLYKNDITPYVETRCNITNSEHKYNTCCKVLGCYSPIYDCNDQYLACSIPPKNGKCCNNVGHTCDVVCLNETCKSVKYNLHVLGTNIIRDLTFECNNFEVVYEEYCSDIYDKIVLNSIIPCWYNNEHIEKDIQYEKPTFTKEPMVQLFFICATAFFFFDILSLLGSACVCVFFNYRIKQLS